MARDPITPNATKPNKNGPHGEIAKFIPQTSPSVINVDARGQQTYELVFKGPTGKSSMLDSILVSMQNRLLVDATDEQGSLTWFFANSDNVIDWGVGAYYPDQSTPPMYLVLFPTLPDRNNFFLDSWTVEECQAGLMVVFRIKFCTRVVPDYLSEDVPEWTQWSCTMMQTQIDALAFCSNKEKDGSLNPDAETGTYTTRIQTWVNQSNDTAFLKPDYKFQSILGTGKIQELNEMEKKIADFHVNGIKCLRHYPVVQKIQQYEGQPNVSFELVDHIVTPTQMNAGVKVGEKNPFDIDDWEWLCTGISCSYDSSTNKSRVTTEYTGTAKSGDSSTPPAQRVGWPKEYYGTTQQGRWTVGGVYVEQNQNT